jgi:hypothetical protein
MSRPCEKLGENWKKNYKDMFDDSTSIPIRRDFFDCGLYYFDGKYNVVKFPKGMSIYHGSARLANSVVEFPLGVEFYKEKEFLKSDALVLEGDDDILESLSEISPISQGWFGNQLVAEIYSKTGGIGEEFISGQPEPWHNCGKKCTFAFKLKKDIVLFLMNDKYNMLKILENKELPENLKQNYKDMFDVDNNSFYRGEPDTFNKIKFINPTNRISNRKWDIPFGGLICKHVITPEGYAGYGSPATTSTKRGMFHLELILCNITKWLERDLNNIMDWQSNNEAHLKAPDVIKTFIKQLRLYETSNVNFHAGNLLEHSIWSLLNAENIIEYKILPLMTDEENKLIAFTTFIHDIGKMIGRKPNRSLKKFIYFSIPEHSIYGSKYILGDMKLPIYDENLDRVGELDIDQLFRAFGINISYKILVASVVQNHCDFIYKVLRKYNSIKNEPTREQVDTIRKDYITEILKVYKYNLTQSYVDLDTISSSNLYLYIYTSLVVSMSDIKGTQVYGAGIIGNIKKDTKNINKESLFFPYLTNMPKKYPGGDILKVSKVVSIGMSFAKHILNTQQEVIISIWSGL